MSRDRNAAEISAIAERTVTDRSNTVRNGDTGKFAATAESTVLDRSNTVGYVDTGKIAATAERTVADWSNTVRNIDTCEFAAVAERIAPDRSNTAWNVDTGKIAATVEGITLNWSNTVRNIDTCELAATIERKVADRSNAVGYVDSGKIAATAERPVPDRSNAVRNGDTGKIVAIAESTATDCSNTVGNSITAGEFLRSFDQSVAFFIDQNTVLIGIKNWISRQNDYIAVTQCIMSDGGNTGGNGDRIEIFAFCKSPRANSCHAVGYCYLFELVAILESLFSYSCNSVMYGVTAGELLRSFDQSIALFIDQNTVTVKVKSLIVRRNTYYA